MLVTTKTKIKQVDIHEYLFVTIKPTGQKRKPSSLQQIGKAMKRDPQFQMMILKESRSCDCLDCHEILELPLPGQIRA